MLEEVRLDVVENIVDVVEIDIKRAASNVCALCNCRYVDAIDAATLHEGEDAIDNPNLGRNSFGCSSGSRKSGEDLLAARGALF